LFANLVVLRVANLDGLLVALKLVEIKVVLLVALKVSDLVELSVGLLVANLVVSKAANLDGLLVVLKVANLVYL
jgi:hypothetical protein